MTETLADAAAPWLLPLGLILHGPESPTWWKITSVRPNARVMTGGYRMKPCSVLKRRPQMEICDASDLIGKRLKGDPRVVTDSGQYGWDYGLGSQLVDAN